MSNKPTVPGPSSGHTLWGGRFSEATDAFVQRFTASVSFDQRMYRQDIRGSIAHARMLQQAGILTADECAAIAEGLLAIQADIDAGNFTWSVELEDVHMNIESELTKRIGLTGTTDPSAKCAARYCRARSRHHHAGFHTPANCTADYLWASSAGLV
jgi:argininosuccinate lyase